MSEHSPIDEFLGRFRVELKGVRWWRHRGIISEIHDHLENVAAEERAGGYDKLESERRAVARFGDPKTVADQFRAEQRGSLRLLALATMGATTLVVVIAVARLGAGSNQPVLVRATPPPIVGGTPAQRQLIGRLSRPFPLPGVTELRIENSYHNPRNRHWRGALVLVTPTGPQSDTRGWVGVANAWAGSAIINAYYTSPSARHLPALANVLTGNAVSGLTVSYRQKPTAQPAYPYTSADYRRDVQRAVAKAHVTLVRAALVHVGGWNSYIEVEVDSPKMASRVNDGFTDDRRLTGSLVLIDNGCQQPLVADSLYVDGSGYDWADPAWIPPHSYAIPGASAATTSPAPVRHGSSCSSNGPTQNGTITTPAQPATPTTQLAKSARNDPIRGRQLARALTPRLSDFGSGWRQLPNGDPMDGYRCDPSLVGADQLAQTTHPAHRFGDGSGMTVTGGAQAYRTQANAGRMYGRALAAKRINCLAAEAAAVERRDAPRNEIVGRPAVVGPLVILLPPLGGVGQGARDWEIRIPITKPTGITTDDYVDVLTLEIGHGITEITMINPHTPLPKAEIEHVAQRVARRGAAIEIRDYQN